MLSQLTNIDYRDEIMVLYIEKYLKEEVDKD